MTEDIRNGRILVSEGLHLINRDTDDDGMPAEDAVLAQIGGRGRVRRFSALQLQHAVDMGEMMVIDRHDLEDAAWARPRAAGNAKAIELDREVRLAVKRTIEDLRADGTIFPASELGRLGGRSSCATRVSIDEHAAH